MEKEVITEKDSKTESIKDSSTIIQEGKGYNERNIQELRGSYEGIKTQGQAFKNLEGSIRRQFESFNKKEDKMQNEIKQLKNTVKKLEKKLTENSIDKQHIKYIETRNIEYEKRFLELERKVGELEVHNKKRKNEEKIILYVKQSYNHRIAIEIESLNITVSEFMKICKKYIKIDNKGIFCYRGLCLYPEKNLTEYGIKNCDTLIYLYKQI